MAYKNDLGCTNKAFEETVLAKAWHRNSQVSSVCVFVCACTRAQSLSPIRLFETPGAIAPVQYGFPGGSDGKESACKVGDQGSIPGSGRSGRLTLSLSGPVAVVV